MLISLVVINIAIIVIKIYNICHFIYFSDETLDEMSILEKLNYSDFCISRFKLDNNFNQNYADLIEYFSDFYKLTDKDITNIAKRFLNN